MTAIANIKTSLNQLPTGEPFAANLFYSLASAENVRQALSRLVNAGEIKRLSRGIFIKPKRTMLAGSGIPPTEELIEAIAKITGETIAIHGAEAARQLQLTTQAPLKPIYHTSGYSRSLKLSNQPVELRHMSPKKLALAGTLPGLVISALDYIGKENISETTIEKLQKNLGAKQFKQVLNALQHMPGWMANIFYRFQKNNENL